MPVQSQQNDPPTRNQPGADAQNVGRRKKRRAEGIYVEEGTSVRRRAEAPERQDRLGIRKAGAATQSEGGISVNALWPDTKISRALWLVRFSGFSGTGGGKC